ncbi:MAG: queuosine precursor transporter [Phycisphaerales bacterium]
MVQPPADVDRVSIRRERVFLVLAGVFLGTLAMLNILGITRFIKLGEATISGRELVFAVAVGVLPYPITFLCTDFISELYGRARANAVVWVGLLLNVWVMFILWIGGVLPGFEQLASDGQLARDAAGRVPLFFELRTFAFGAVVASMIAYLIAQLVDVWLFHFWKRLTNGRHLWLRNNGSTIISQLVDTIAVILITWKIGGLAGVLKPNESLSMQLLLLIATGYAFKVVVALLDTIPFYLGVGWLRKYLALGENEEVATLMAGALPPGGAT